METETVRKGWVGRQGAALTFEALKAAEGEGQLGVGRLVEHEVAEDADAAVQQGHVLERVLLVVLEVGEHLEADHLHVLLELVEAALVHLLVLAVVVQQEALDHAAHHLLVGQVVGAQGGGRTPVRAGLYGAVLFARRQLDLLGVALRRRAEAAQKQLLEQAEDQRRHGDDVEGHGQVEALADELHVELGAGELPLGVGLVLREGEKAG